MTSLLFLTSSLESAQCIGSVFDIHGIDSTTWHFLSLYLKLTRRNCNITLPTDMKDRQCNSFGALIVGSETKASWLTLEAYCPSRTGFTISLSRSHVLASTPKPSHHHDVSLWFSPMDTFSLPLWSPVRRYASEQGNDEAITRAKSRAI